MTPLELFSEPFQPTGSIASEGIRNVLGRPAMDLLTLLVREAGQNSWDARTVGVGPIDFRLDGWHLTEAQIDLARTELFPEQPANIPLRELLDTDGASVLMVSDRGTSGLGGPLRADQVTDDDTPRDFVDFLRNIGQPPDKRFGGGTFGYGKSVLYNASEVRTILVYTRCRTSTGFESRLIGSALGGQVRAEVAGRSRPFTGRHWWGRTVDAVIDPVLNDEADFLAGRMGFAVMHGDETGTSLMILGPRFEERQPQEAMAYLGEASIWSFWPKMVEVGARPVGMRIAGSWQGEEIRVTAPEQHPLLRGFVAALRETDRPDGNRIAIVIKRPQRHLGWLAFHRFAVSDPDPNRPGADAAPIRPGVHHAALMRTPRNIVRYIAGDPLPHEAAGYAAVFIADDEVDGAFAEAEPPSHDDWLPEVLERGHRKRFVTVALRNIGQELQNHVAPPTPPRGRTNMPPLGAISNELASIFPWEEGSGAGVELGPPTRDGGIPFGPTESTTADTSGRGAQPLPRTRLGRPRIDMQRPHLDMEGGRPVIRLEFSVTAASGAASTRVALDAAVAVQDGDAVEDDPPAGAERPRLLRWEAPDGVGAGDDPQLVIPAGREGQWTAIISTGGDIAVGLNLTAEAVPA
jgi:hypothetical protein